MRLYAVNDLLPNDLERLTRSLDNKGLAGALDRLYWLETPESLLTDVQREHLSECGPYAMGLEILEDGVQLELLVRARSRLRCSCVAYATAAQREYAIETVDALFRDLDIPV